jgi:hypothetical protein
MILLKVSLSDISNSIKRKPVMKHILSPLRKQEAGMGHILVIALIVVVLAVIGAAGYEVSHKNKPKASTNSTTVSSNSAAPASDAACVATYHDANLCKFSTNSDISKIPYTATLTTVNSSGGGTMTLSSDGKGNTSSTLTGNGTTLSTIQLAGSSYVQTTSGGTWYEYPAGSSAPSSTSNPTSSMSLALGSTVTYKPLGTSACGSLTCYEYSVTTALTPGQTQYVWFDTGQYKLREWKDTDNTGDSTDMKLTYPGSVTISKPSPVEPYTDMTL